MEAIFTINAEYESFSVETMYSIELYDTSNGDKAWDVAEIKAAILRALLGVQSNNVDKL